MEILDIAISVGSAATILIAIAAILIRRPYLGFVFLFYFVAFSWRITNTFAIDVFGPIYADELSRNIGPGLSTLPLSLSQGLVILAILVSFRPARLRALCDASRNSVLAKLPAGPFTVSDLAFVAIVPFVAALYIELIVRGHIPLFEIMEPLTYRQFHAGPLHLLLVKWGAMLAFQLGVFFSAPALHARPFDRRFAYLLLALFVYLLLIGQRFSPYYLNGAFFLIPVGVILLHRHFTLASETESERQRRRLIGWFIKGGLVIAVLVTCAVAYSFTVVRSFQGDELIFKVTQRIFIQQGEMWWTTYERIFLQGGWNFWRAADAIFVHPFDPTRNSTMQYLMEMALPTDRAHDLLSQGSAYTGGWPEVLFELGGPVGGFVLAALSAFAFSEFMYLVSRCVVQRRYATLFFLTPIVYSLAVYLVSGMVNSFIQVTFLVKVLAALLVYLLEDRWRLTLADEGVTRVT